VAVGVIKVVPRMAGRSKPHLILTLDQLPALVGVPTSKERVSNEYRSSTSHGQISEEAVHAAAQPSARARLAHPKRARRGIRIVQQDRGRAAYHKKSSIPFIILSILIVLC